MFSLLARVFIKDYKNYKEPAVRRAYGSLSGIVGISCNIMLFTIKLIAGIMTASISVTADALNNLSDAGSSIVTLIGFKMAGKPADHSHPYGHGRIEYIAGFVVSMIIIIVGAQLGLNSFDKILNPTVPEVSLFTIIVLVISIGVKLWMFVYNRATAIKIESNAMKATSRDSISDVLATTVVLAGSAITFFTGIAIDGWLGLAVSIFIVITGIMTAQDTMGDLLGKPPKPELIEEIRQTVMSYPEIIGIHDLIIHDYGPGRMMMSLHAEVPSNANIMQIHDTIDIIETVLMKKYDCTAIIHMDPVETDNKVLIDMHQKIAQLVKLIDPAITIHDFRMTAGPIHSNLIFDVVVPMNFRLSDAEVKEAINLCVKTLDEKYRAVINIDKAYI